MHSCSSIRVLFGSLSDITLLRTVFWFVCWSREKCNALRIERVKMHITLLLCESCGSVSLLHYISYSEQWSQSLCSNIRTWCWTAFEFRQLGKILWKVLYSFRLRMGNWNICCKSVACFSRRTIPLSILIEYSIYDRHNDDDGAITPFRMICRMRLSTKNVIELYQSINE